MRKRPPKKNINGGGKRGFTDAEIKIAFAEFAATRGVKEPHGGFIADGKLHRCDVIAEPANKKNAASYRLFSDGIPAGWIQNWTDGAGPQNWCTRLETELTADERTKHRKRLETSRKAFETEQAARNKGAAKKASLIWNSARPAPDSHPYLENKGVPASGARIHDDGRIIIPAQDTENALHSIQFIDDKGEKRFLSDGATRGNFCIIGDIVPDGELLIAEGFATGLPVVIAFNCGNMPPVAQGIRQKYPKADIILCADLDSWTVSRPGEHDAAKAAATVSGRVAVPQFSDLRSNGETDFNDLHRLEGLEAVRRSLEAAKQAAPASAPRLRSFGGYQAKEDGLYWDKAVKDGNLKQKLANFNAWIVGECIEDDGAERRSLLDIEAEISGRTSKFSISAGSFSAMAWPVENIGADAILEPGLGTKDRARAGIQYLSGRIPRRVSYTHCGWRHFDNGIWAYLHAGGAIGPKGALTGVDVNMPDALARYILPAPGSDGEIAKAVCSSLSLLELAPDRIMIPLLGSIYRAAIGNADFSIHIVGFTGSGKTEAAALGQQHFGAEMHAKGLPASWSSTANQLEGVAFLAKDAPLVIDDFIPQGSSLDRARLNQTADRVLRGVGNAAGRGRARPDGSPRPAKPPRALVISTGEEIPGGQSLRARLLVIEVKKGDIGNGDLRGLGPHQEAASSGAYAMAMAGFIQWLAMGYEGRKAEFERDAKDRRHTLAPSACHARTGDIAAQLAATWRFVVRFAVDCGAISETEAAAYLARADAALITAAEEQAEVQGHVDPIERFRALFSGVIASGRGHIAGASDEIPSEPAALGWKSKGYGWEPNGRLLGWEDGSGGLYLEPEAAFVAVQEMAAQTGEGVGIGSATLRKRLHERGFLLSTETDRSKVRLTVRQTIGGRRRNVLHVSNLLSIPENSAPSAPRAPIDEKEPQDQRSSSTHAAEKSAPLKNGSAPSAPNPGQKFTVMNGLAHGSTHRGSRAGNGRDDLMEVAV
jgi:phage/plasmid primase-like uncharacterized protein